MIFTSWLTFLASRSLEMKARLTSLNGEARHNKPACTGHETSTRTELFLISSSTHEAKERAKTKRYSLIEGISGVPNAKVKETATIDLAT